VIICAVASIYWLGHRRDWQGQWLRARTTAELIGYLPMLAPIVDFDHGSADADWYLRVFDPGQHLREAEDVAAMCLRIERWRASGSPTHGAIPRSCQATRAGPSRARRTAPLPSSVAFRQKALQRRVHGLNTWLSA